MNEKIKQLALQAGLYAFVSDNGVDPDLEKFAELIINEVTDLLDREQWNKGQDWICEDGYRIIERVEEHFGVE